MKTSKSIITAVIVLVMVNNVEHLAWVHYELAMKLFPIVPGDWLNKLHSVAVVVIFEIVVITFAREGKQGYSQFFAFCIWILSMIYYDTPGLFMAGNWQLLIAAAVYSTIFTISIYMFSEMLAERQNETRMEAILADKNLRLQAESNELKEHNIKAQDEINELKANCNELPELRKSLALLQREKEEMLSRLKCPYCKHYKAESEAQLRAHKGHCSHNPVNKK
ncbi:MAG: hypothetical protein RIC03_12440 [Cyclobacteriaceae bacterium]